MLFLKFDHVVNMANKWDVQSLHSKNNFYLINSTHFETFDHVNICENT